MDVDQVVKKTGARGKYKLVRRKSERLVTVSLLSYELTHPQGPTTTNFITSKAITEPRKRHNADDWQEAA